MCVFMRLNSNNFTVTFLHYFATKQIICEWYAFMRFLIKSVVEIPFDYMKPVKLTLQTLLKYLQTFWPPVIRLWSNPKCVCVCARAHFIFFSLTNPLSFISSPLQQPTGLSWMWGEALEIGIFIDPLNSKEPL